VGCGASSSTTSPFEFVYTFIYPLIEILRIAIKEEVTVIVIVGDFILYSW
jgi:hypothetical protein